MVELNKHSTVELAAQIKSLQKKKKTRIKYRSLIYNQNSRNFVVLVINVSHSSNEI